VVGPAAKREIVQYMKKNHQISIGRSCRLLSLGLTTYYYISRRSGDTKAREALRRVAQKRHRWGYRRLKVLLAREGIKLNHKKVFRLYQEEKLQLKKRRKKQTRKWRGEKAKMPEGPNERWSMDFVHDSLKNYRRLRMLNVVDDYTRECLWIEVGQSITGQRVADVMAFLIHLRGKPKTIVTDNGPEFTGRALDTWAYENKVHIHHIQPGKPVQNAFVESFNGRLRDETMRDLLLKTGELIITT